MNANRGFTLIEIMVVVLIIGITIGFAVLAFGDFGRSRQVAVAGEQLVQYIKLIEQQAILEGKYFKISVNSNNYNFFRFDVNNQWAPLQTHILRSQKFPDDLSINFSTASSNVHSSGDILIDPSGALTPFSLVLSAKSSGAKFALSGAANGNIATEQAKP